MYSLIFKLSAILMISHVYVCIRRCLIIFLICFICICIFSEGRQIAFKRPLILYRFIWKKNICNTETCTTLTSTLFILVILFYEICFIDISNITIHWNRLWLCMLPQKRFKDFKGDLLFIYFWHSVN